MIHTMWVFFICVFQNEFNQIINSCCTGNGSIIIIVFVVFLQNHELLC